MLLQDDLLSCRFEGTGHGPGYEVVEISEGNHVVKNLFGREELRKSHLLRHRIFAEELKWVPISESCLEVDGYDNRNAVPFGVLDEAGELSAYMRLIMTDEPFMMESEFAFLVDPGHRIRKCRDTAEVSRLCVAPEARNETVSGNFGMHSTSILLLKGVYQWCLINRVDFLYAVTEEKIYRLFRAKGFPFRLIGEPVKMPDGVVAAALMMDWREFEETNKAKRPKLFDWFSRVQSSSTSPKSNAIAAA